MPSLSSPPTVKLSTDTIDDLIYFSRTADLESLTELTTSLSTTHSVPASTILASAIDIDDDGLGSGSCLLHYPAANGSVEVVNYLLSLFENNNNNSTTISSSTSNGIGVPESEESRLKFVNHQNTSGNTPLHWAGMNGRLEVVQALVKAGADPEVVNGAGRDVVVESEWSGREGAAECAVWMLHECGGLEKGVGGSNGVENGEGSSNSHDIVGLDGTDVVEDMVVNGEGEGQDRRNGTG